jgi:hypothetical protein
MGQQLQISIKSVLKYGLIFLLLVGLYRCGSSFRSDYLTDIDVNTPAVTKVSPCTKTAQDYKDEDVRDQIVELKVKSEKARKFTFDEAGNRGPPSSMSSITAYISLMDFYEKNPDCCKFMPSFNAPKELSSHPTQTEINRGWKRAFFLQWRDVYIGNDGLRKVDVIYPGAHRYYLISNCGDFTLARHPDQCSDDGDCYVGEP